MRHWTWRCFFSSAFLVDLFTGSCPFLLFVNVLLSNAQFCRTHVDISTWKDQRIWLCICLVQHPCCVTTIRKLTLCCKYLQMSGGLGDSSKYFQLRGACFPNIVAMITRFLFMFASQIAAGTQTCPKNFPCRGAK